MLKQKREKGTRVRSDPILECLDKNIFNGKFRELLVKHKLAEIWKEALLQVVLIADRQVTHYIQVSGYPLTSETSKLAWIVTGLKKEVFRESGTEEFARLYDHTHVIIDRKSLTPQKASDELQAFRNGLLRQDQDILTKTFQRWISASAPEEIARVFSSILKTGHPVRRTLNNFLRRERNADFLKDFSFECSSTSSTQRVATRSAKLFARCVLKNLIFESSRSQLENFVRKHMQTRIDNGSVDRLEASLRALQKKPKWIRKLEVNKHQLFQQCLFAFLVKLVVLNVHSVFEVSSRSSSPKVPEYAVRGDVCAKRKECLANLVRNNLESTDGPAHGSMLALPKASPFEYRPVFKYARSKPYLSVPLRSYLQCLKSDSQAKL